MHFTALGHTAQIFYGIKFLLSSYVGSGLGIAAHVVCLDVIFAFSDVVIWYVRNAILSHPHS